MTIYQDSKRIVGTNADRIGTPAVLGGWKELARTTLGSAGDTISVSSLPDKRYYMILSDISSSGQGATYPRINNDSGSNYSIRYQKDGGTDVTLTSETKFTNYNGGFTNANVFHVSYLANYASKEKLLINHSNENETLGAATAPFRREYTGKWANTSDAVNRWDAVNFGTGDFASGSEVVVLGWDPDDTHTDNFWEELASVETVSSGTLSSGTFTAKKYLWVQAYTPSSSNASPDGYVEFNGDSGTNYAHRRSHNGGADTTGTSDGIGIRIDGTGGQTAKFHNLFIINNANNEKLVIAHSITGNTAGAGTAPSRTESVGKWVNTSNQITRVDIIDQYASDQWGAGSFIKVWGSN
jgi:hypothetical protein